MTARDYRKPRKRFDGSLVLCQGLVPQSRRRRKYAVRSIFVVVLGMTSRHLVLMLTNPPLMLAKPTKIDTLSTTGNALSTDQCNELRSHEHGGHWRHHYFHVGEATENASSIDLAASIERHYTPLEKSWLQGEASNFTKEACGRTAPGLMYVSTLGNQCGCSVDGFRPRHSAWSNAREYEGHDTPSVRLARNLARSNQTLCFMGDSIDFQFYAALRNNLERVRLLQATHGARSQQGGFVDIETRSLETPVTYTNDTGFSYFSLSAFRKLTQILQTVVTIDGLTTTFKWIKLYGWSPMHTSFADDCTVIVGNLALHYDENTGELKNPINILLLNTLALDFRAFVGWMLDFTSASAGRRAIWRSALPQHFGTDDGHHVKGKHCSPLKRTDGRVIQKYNMLYEKEFAQFCDANRAATECAPYEHVCTANRTSLEIGSLYRYYVGTNCCRERRERLEREEDNVTGRILRWDVADLFDVPEWHVHNDDCSHFCYIPQLYEAAFERLDILLGHV